MAELIVELVTFALIMRFVLALFDSIIKFKRLTDKIAEQDRVIKEYKQKMKEVK